MSGANDERSPLFALVVVLGGMVFGVGLAVSRMTHPEVVLRFLRFEDLGLLLVMGGAAFVTGVVFRLGPQLLGRGLLTGKPLGRRVKSFDRNVLVGGAVFGVGWGLSGICPGAAYASFGVGNLPILWAIAGMFAGAYVQGVARSSKAGETAHTPTDD
ncbi:MAG: DUF6691 family protein [Halosimplex sp.]